MAHRLAVLTALVIGSMSFMTLGCSSQDDEVVGHEKKSNKEGESKQIVKAETKPRAPGKKPIRPELDKELAVRSAEERKQAVKALRAIDGVESYWNDVGVRFEGATIPNGGVKILYDFEVRTSKVTGRLEEIPEAEVSLPGPDELRELMGIDYLADVVLVDFSGAIIRDEDLRHLRHFDKLKSLRLPAYGKITAVGLDHLVRLTSLTELYLSDNRLTALPPEIGKLTNLTHLDLKNNQLTSPPPEIGRLAKLTALYLYGNQLTSLPPEIGQLTELALLDLGSNRLTTLPPEIGKLTNLTSLEITGNQLTSLPPEFGNLTKLTRLSLFHNQLTSLPPEIGNLTKLTYLRMGKNQISALPVEIGQLTNLTILDLAKNNLTSLPHEFAKLKKLTKLGLGYNRLTSLPPEFGKLSQMTTLSLTRNPITDADLELLESQKQWEYLYIDKTKVSKEGVANLKRAFPNCYIYNDFYPAE